MDPALIIQKIAVNAVPLVFCIILHEVSHGYVAERLGDPTARMLGRLTLNPLPHIDPIGTIVVPLILLLSGGTIFGWAKPVPISSVNFKNPDRDMALCAAAGPATNILLGLASALLLRGVVTLIAAQPGELAMKVLSPVALMLNASILWNVFLAVFNMIPLLPLDGGRVLQGLLPRRLAYSYSRIEPYGFVILMVLIFTGITRYLVIPPAAMLLGFLQSISGVRIL